MTKSITHGNDNFLEVEVKISLNRIEPVRKRILEMGFIVSETRNFEQNIIYDTCDLQLKQTKRLLRLRRKGEHYILTFKRPAAVDRELACHVTDHVKEHVKGQVKAQVKDYVADYKVREEIEVEVSDFVRAEMIITGLGYEVFFIYEKYREIFRKGDTSIMIDETPIGDYLEIEGSPLAIDEVALGLGYSKSDYITANYYTLFKKTNLTGHMQFKQAG